MNISLHMYLTHCWLTKELYALKICNKKQADFKEARLFCTFWRPSTFWMEEDLKPLGPSGDTKCKDKMSSGCWDIVTIPIFSTPPRWFYVLCYCHMNGWLHNCMNWVSPIKWMVRSHKIMMTTSFNKKEALRSSVTSRQCPCTEQLWLKMLLYAWEISLLFISRVLQLADSQTYWLCSHTAL